MNRRRTERRCGPLPVAVLVTATALGAYYRRIAYRVGIDIAFIEELIAGETEPERFAHLVKRYRAGRYQQRLRESIRRTGISRYELQQKIEREFEQETDL